MTVTPQQFADHFTQVFNTLKSSDLYDEKRQKLRYTIALQSLVKLHTETQTLIEKTTDAIARTPLVIIFKSVREATLYLMSKDLPEDIWEASEEEFLEHHWNNLLNGLKTHMPLDDPSIQIMKRNNLPLELIDHVNNQFKGTILFMENQED